MKKKFKSYGRTRMFLGDFSIFWICALIHFFFNICILYIIIILCRVFLKSIRDTQIFFKYVQPTGTFSQLVELSVFLLVSELKNGPPAEHVPVVLRSIYQFKFFKKYCRRNFRTIDLTWNSYFLFVIIIFDEKYRKNEKKIGFWILSLQITF